MTSTVDFTPTRPTPLSRLFGADPTLAGLGFLIVLSLAVTLPAMAFDTRLFQGENIWLKPVKFQIALAIYALTLAACARWLPDGFLQRRAVRIYLAAVVFAILAEMAWIGGAAMFGTASHFNVGTPLTRTLYAIMGVMAVLLTSASLVYGIAIWRNRASGLSAPLHLSLALGLILTFVLTVPAASIMSSGTGHYVGTPATGEVLAVLGWSREVGDLRVPHFFATHAMHALPIIGLIAAPLARGLLIVIGAAVAYVLFVAATLVQAMAGLPLIPLL